LIINTNTLNLKLKTHDCQCAFFSSDGACDVYFPGYNKICMPTIRQIVFDSVRKSSILDREGIRSISVFGSVRKSSTFLILNLNV